MYISLVRSSHRVDVSVFRRYCNTVLLSQTHLKFEGIMPFKMLRPHFQRAQSNTDLNMNLYSYHFMFLTQTD